MTISLKQWSCMLWRTNEIRGFLQLRTNWLPWGGGLTIITHGQSGLYICTGGKGGGGGIRATVYGNKLSILCYFLLNNK